MQAAQRGYLQPLKASNVNILFIPSSSLPGQATRCGRLRLILEQMARLPRSTFPLTYFAYS
eukprot:1482439-Pyramimonas_sp.AAC.1